MKKLIESIRSLFLRAYVPAFANVAAGTHSGHITRTLAAAVTGRYTLVKNGSAPNTVEPCGVSDRPLGIATDTGAVGEAININLTGVTSQTQLLTAASVITAGDLLYVASAGRVQRLPSTAGTFYEVGVALSGAGAAGELIEVATHAPQQLINIAAFTGNATNDLAKLATALEQRPDKIRLLSI